MKGIYVWNTDTDAENYLIVDSTPQAFWFTMNSSEIDDGLYKPRRNGEWWFDDFEKSNKDRVTRIMPLNLWVWK